MGHNHNKDRQQGFAGVKPVATQDGRKKTIARSTLIILAIIIIGIIYLLAANRGERDDAVMGTDVATTTEFMLEGDAATDEQTSSAASGNQSASISGAVSGLSTVQIAVLANPELFDYPNNRVHGCDVVALVPQRITPTPRVLNAAIALLFGGIDDFGFTPGNFIATQTDLRFVEATIQNRVATVHLAGSVGPIAGVCDVPRIETQIEQTALQFSTVDAVNIFLNGEPLQVE